MAGWLSGGWVCGCVAVWLGVGWVIGLGSAVACTCPYVKACEFMHAISRRVLIAHGVKRHPFGILIGGVSGRAVWRMRVERCCMRVCVSSRVQ